jgi:hypothetical protein
MASFLNDIVLDPSGRTLCTESTVFGDEEKVLEKRGLITQLAFLSSTIGIAVALPQPVNYNPYHVASQSVIRSSPTLAALSEAFATVSCGSLSQRDIVTVIDRSPFIRLKDQISCKLQRVSRGASFDSTSEKKPDVVLCVGEDRVKIEGRIAEM